jgi:hypothetical protein
MTRKQNRRARGPGRRYTPLLHDPSDPDGGWIVWDTHRQRAVRRLLAVRIFRGRRGLERAGSCAGKLNDRAGR